MNSDIGFYTVIHEMNYFYKRISFTEYVSQGDILRKRRKQSSYPLGPRKG